MKRTGDRLPLLLLLSVIASSSTANNEKKEKCSQIEITEFQNPSDGVCSSMHIRDSIQQFRKLENCTVIEGYLQISMIETASPEEYSKWSFPELREITAYLTFYRVFGLKSLRQLFPNLAIIRGRELFINYALVIFEMHDLEELGLISLHTISRGGVRIAKSEKLCYIDTVDWEHLGVDPGGQDFQDNKEESQCANYCPDDCPTTRTAAGLEVKRCWTSQNCQQGLNCKCKMNQTCMENGACCHEYCLGGCSGPGPENCVSCKGVKYLDKCYPECPPDTYKYADSRCLTAKECFAVANSTEKGAFNTKILRSEKAELRVCVSQCPQNYTVQVEGDLKNLECINCQGFCPKVCNGSEVSSIEDAQKFKDCNKITGSLTIQIMGGSNVAYEMEKNMGNIKEVTGYINVRRSYALMTLYFFKNLEIIGGETLFLDRYSFIVMDNSNLQDLFPEEQMQKLRVNNGRMSFHSNRKLCEHKIKRFIYHMNLTLSEQEIGGENGNLMPCIEKELNLTFTSIYSSTVVLKWDKDTADGRHLLTYIINYRELKSENEEVNIYEGRDACSADTWMTVEAAPKETNGLFETFALDGLKAYTYYAVYVQAYTLSSAPHNAMTRIKTFRTNPYYPSEPLELEVTSEDPHELHVSWKPPKFPNGIVTHYKVVYQKQELDIKSFSQRDYCHEPISAPIETTKTKQEESEKIQNVSTNCCSCNKPNEDRESEARKREIEIYFENYLHTQVYCKRYDYLPEGITLRVMQDGWYGIINMERPIDGKNNSNSMSDELLPTSSTNIAPVSSDTEGNALQNNNLTVLIQEVIVNDTDVYLPNLEHFQEYNIEVQACHDTDPNEPIGTRLCSNRALSAGRTKASWIMDRINESTINVQIIRNVTVDVLITWQAPPKPNGLILTYSVFYKKANQDNLVPQQVCVNIRDFQKYSGYRLRGLDPGNWTFQIYAASLAGNKSYTSEKYFIVPHATEKEDSDVAIIIGVVFVVLFLVFAVGGAMCYIKYKIRKDVMTVISPNINYIPSEPVYTMDGWEVDREKIRLIRELGQGSFGMVYEGVAKGLHDDPDEEIRVAVKTVNDRASFNDKREFLKEATTMKAFDCFHVVKLLGVVSTGQPALVIMELMALGDLKNYLREHRPDPHERPGVSPPKLLDILQMAGEIADGMAYLADKKFVHRDLAARNCMVAEDKTVKIGDFGMTRDIYETDYYRKGGKGMLPVRWMAPESLKDGVFTSMSDVWSYGVVMWEMVTLAAQPYQGLSNEEVVKYISEGNTMDIPAGCPEEMAYLMQRCWARRPNHRPTFKAIIEYLLPHLNRRFEKVSYFFNDGGGPRGTDGSEMELFEAEGSDYGGSVNSLSYEAAADPQQSFTNISDNYQFRGSPQASGGSVSHYDDDMDSESFMNDDGEAYHQFPQRRNLHVDDNFEELGDCNIHNEFGLDLDDSSQPFISDNFQAIPFKMWNAPLQSHVPSGNDSMPHNSGLVELQPLINKGPTPSSPKLTSIQSSNPYSSEFISHPPPTVTTYNIRSPNESQTLQQQHHTAVTPAVADSSASSPPNSHLRQSEWTPSARQVPSSVVSQPILRLPTLNQPPSGGFRRMPLYKQGDKGSQSSSRNTNRPSSSDWENPQPASATVNLVNSEEETSPASTALHNFPPGAITSSSDDSKESSKSSGSYSHMNGLTNGHIPMIRHRPAPC